MPNYLYYSLSFLWVYSGLVPILFNQSQSLDLLHAMGVGVGFDWVLLILASVLDLSLALLIIIKKEWAWIWLVQFWVVVLYSILIVVFLTDTLLHPFAPVIKNIPILAMLWWLYRHQTTSYQK